MTSDNTNISELSASETDVHKFKDNVITPFQIFIVSLCFLFNTLDGFDITAMAVVAGDVSSELSLSPDNLGWIFSFALAGMMCGAMLLAPLADKYGRRKLIIISISLVAVSILLTAQASSLTEFIVLRFFSGIGAGGVLASQASLAAEYAPIKYRSLAVCIVTSGYPAGAMLTAVFAGFILPDYGWRGMFWLGGTVTLGMVGIAWLFIPESLAFLFHRRPKNALEKVNKIFVKLKEPTIVDLPPTDASEQLKSPGVISSMLRLVDQPYRSRTIILWSVFFLSIATLYFLLSWVPKLMEDAGYSAVVGRQAFFALNLGGVLGIYLLGFLSTRFRLTNIIFVMLLAASIAMVAFAFLQSAELNVLLVIIFIIGVLQQGGYTGLYSAAANAYPTEIRSTGIGWAIGLGRLGAVAGPAIAGYLVAAGATMSVNFLVFAVPVAIAALLAYRLHID